MSRTGPPGPPHDTLLFVLYSVLSYIYMYISLFYTFLLPLLVNNAILMNFAVKYLQVDVTGLYKRQNKNKCSHFYIMYSEFICICSLNTQNDSGDEGLSDILF